MTDRAYRLSRRKFLAQTAVLTLSGGVAGRALAKEQEAPAGVRTRPAKPSSEGRKPIAVITTVYRPMSHSYHIAGRFVHGYALNVHYHLPKHYVRSFFLDQVPG